MQKKSQLTLLIGLLIFIVGCGTANKKKVQVLCKDVLTSLGSVFIRCEKCYDKAKSISKELRLHADVLGKADYEFEKNRSSEDNSVYFQPREYYMTQELTITDKEGIHQCLPSPPPRSYLICGDYVLSPYYENNQIKFPSRWNDDHNQSFGLSGIENVIKNNKLYTPLPVNNGMVLPEEYHNKKKEFRPELTQSFPTILGDDCLQASGLMGTYPVLYEYGGWCRKTEGCTADKGSITSFSMNTLLIPSKYYDYFDYLRTSSRGGDPLTGIEYDCFYDEVDSKLKKKCIKQKDQLAQLLNQEDIIPITIKITIKAPVEKDALGDI